MNFLRYLWANVTNETPWNDFHIAAIQNDVAAIKRHIVANGKGALRETTPEGDTPLLLAAKFGCNEALCALLESGADPNQPRSALIEILRAGKGTSPISIETLVERGADLDATCETLGLNALGWCAKTGNASALKQLLSTTGAKRPGAKGVSERERRIDPYFIAARHGHFDCLKLLLFYEDPDAMSLCPCGAYVVIQETPLCFASREGHAECVEFLLSCGANPDTTRPPTLRGPSPLLLAAGRGHLRVVERLEPITKTRKFYEGTRKSILHVAAENGHLDVVKYAIEVGYDPNAETVPGNRTRAFSRLLERAPSPLSLAVSAGHTDVVKYLLKNGASMRDHDSARCPMWQAFPNLEMMDTAFEHGATVCDCQREKMFIGQKFHLRGIKLLLDRGLDPEFRCEYSPFGFCVWQIYPASQPQCRSVVELLRIWSNYWPKPTICRHLKQSLQLCKSLGLLDDVLSTSPSLQQLCRVSIRRSLGSQKLSDALCMDELPLPKRLRTFLNCSDVVLPENYE